MSASLRNRPKCCAAANRRDGRVEDGRGSLGHAATLRFPSPLIEPDVPISGIRLSDWLHREVTRRKALAASVFCAAAFSPSPYDTAFSEGSGSQSVFAGSSPITFTSPSSKAHQKSGSFPPPALPGFNGRMTLSDSRQSRRLSATLRPLPSLTTGLPRLLASSFRRAVPTTPADRAGAHVDCFPAHTAFPKWQEGRHPHCHFRDAMGRTVARCHHRRLNPLAGGASHVTTQRLEQVPHFPGAIQYDHCGHRDESIELACRRHCSRHRTPSTEED